MFKIEIQKRRRLNGENDAPYFIRYEILPDISKGAFNRVMHEANYRNLQLAIKDAGKLSDYLAEISVVLDLVYTKLKQIDVCLNQCDKYLKIDFNRVENDRIKLLRDSQKTLFAYDHIKNITLFLNSLKYWCFAISKDYQNTANQLFKMLLNVEESFVNNYRSAQILNSKNHLKIFL